MAKKREAKTEKPDIQYKSVFGDVAGIIEAARRSSARSVNSIMTAAYWLIRRRIVEFEQSGKKRAEYGAALIEKLADDLTQKFGRGFSRQNIHQMRLFHLSYPVKQIRQTVSGKSNIPLAESMAHEIPQTASAESSLTSITGCFPLPWYIHRIGQNHCK